MAKRLRKPKPGDKILASDLADVIAYLIEGGNISAGPGIKINLAQSGIIIALAAALNGYAKAARVTRVYGQNGNLRRDVRYDAVVIAETDSAKVENISPKYCRVGDDDSAITTARVDDLCIVVRIPDGSGGVSADLLMLTEEIQTRLCNTTGGLSGGLPPGTIIGPDGVPVIPGSALPEGSGVTPPSSGIASDPAAVGRTVTP